MSEAGLKFSHLPHQASFCLTVSLTWVAPREPSLVPKTEEAFLILYIEGVVMLENIPVTDAKAKKAYVF